MLFRSTIVAIAAAMSVTNAFTVQAPTRTMTTTAMKATTDRNNLHDIVGDLLRVFSHEKPSVTPSGLSFDDGPFDAYDVLDAKPWSPATATSSEEVVPAVVEEKDVIKSSKDRNNVKDVVADLMHATFGHEKPMFTPNALSFDKGPFDAYDVLEPKNLKP